MNTKLTKIKETEILSAVPESGHVMAEVDGVVKRVPGNKVGGVPDGGEAGQVLTKTEEGAAWTTPESGLPEGGEPYKQLVTDASGETVWEDRLAWKEERLHFIYDEWFEFCKISDEVPGVIPETIAITIASPDGTTENKDVRMIQSSDNAFLYQFWWVVIAKEDNATYTSDVTHIVFPEKGIYLLKQLDTERYLAKATWDGHSYEWDGTYETIKPIDPPLIGGWKALGEGEPVETVLADTTITLTEVSGRFGAAFTSASDLVSGNVYKVLWDNVIYECTAYEMAAVIAIGDATKAGLNGGNGEPFIIFNTDPNNLQVIGETEGEHTIRLSTMAAEIFPVPKKYLPETVYVNEKTFNVYTDEDCAKIYEAFANGKVVLIRPYGFTSEWAQVLSCFYSEYVGLWVVYFKGTFLHYVEGTPANGFTKKSKDFLSEMT